MLDAILKILTKFNELEFDTSSYVKNEMRRHSETPNNGNLSHLEIRSLNNREFINGVGNNPLTSELINIVVISFDEYSEIVPYRGEQNNQYFLLKSAKYTELMEQFFNDESIFSDEDYNWIERMLISLNNLIDHNYIMLQFPIFEKIIEGKRQDECSYCYGLTDALITIERYDVEIRTLNGKFLNGKLIFPSDKQYEINHEKYEINHSNLDLNKPYIIIKMRDHRDKADRPNESLLDDIFYKYGKITGIEKSNSEPNEYYLYMADEEDAERACIENKLYEGDGFELLCSSKFN